MKDAQQTMELQWRLLPSERVLWQSGPEPGISRDRRWYVVPALFAAMAAVVGLFAGLLHVTGIDAVHSTASLAFFMLLTSVAFYNLPYYLLDPCEFMVTTRQVIWRRGRLRRTIERSAITYARIHWHRNAPGVGHLELVRAVPFGPLARKQRILLHDVKAPDRLLALIRDVEPAEFSGYADVSLVERLDPGERVVWGGGPEGLRLGKSEMLTAAVGSTVLFAGAVYAYRSGGLLVALEKLGLSVQSWTWVMLFGAMLITVSIMLITGCFMLYQGVWGARAGGSGTEYILTDSRLLIRRGRTELSLDRQRIVDMADMADVSGLRNVYLILDGPQGRALDDSGVLSMLEPPRAAVAPVLYELRDPEKLRNLLFGDAA